MAIASYSDALRRLLADEGGYSNDAADPGGPTNFGITIIDYRKYVKPGATAADVRAMKVDEAKAIYRAKYWNAMRCDELPAGVDYAVFDYGVNSGIGRAGKVLRRLVGMPANISAITAEVVAAARKRHPQALVGAICDERLAFLQGLKTWPVFGKGWGPRVAGVRSVARAMAGQLASSAAPPLIRPAGSVGKGRIPAPATKAITHTATAATAAAGLGFWGWIGAHPVLSLMIAAAALAAIVAAVRAIKAAHTAQQETPPATLQPVPETVLAKAPA